jgi:ubiquinone/menaquinone biosynthesis C-methylase UbiE
MGYHETEQLNRMMLGVAVSRSLCTVAELGVADHITAGSPQTIAALAAATGTHARSLHRALRLLASNGVFQETTAGSFDHTPLSLVLRSDAEGSFRAGARLFHLFFPGWDGLDHSVRTGEPGFIKVFGQPVFPWVMAHPETGPILDAAMSSFHGYETGAMLDAYDFSGVRVLADIGGGNGSLLTGVLQRFPVMRGILFDLGHVVARAAGNLAQAGVAPRCEVIEGSFFDSIPAGADAYVMRHIIHDWTDEQSLQILGHCRRVIPPDGRLLLVECVVPAGNQPSIAKDFDMTMMVFPGGIERTEAEFRALLAAAGFELTSVTPTATMVSIVEGRPKG